MKLAPVSIILCALFAYGSCECGMLQRLKLKTQWEQAYANTAKRSEFAKDVWDNFFTIAPELLPMFDGVQSDDLGSADFRAHSLRVLSGLDRIISASDLVPVLIHEVGHLRMQHASKGIEPEHFNVMKNALVQTLPSRIGECFDPVVWSDCFDEFASNLITEQA